MRAAVRTRRAHRQQGYLLLNILVSTVASLVIVVSLVTAAIGRARDQELQRALTQAMGIATVADSNDQRVTGSVQDPVTLVYSYTHGGRNAAYQPVTTLNATYGLTLPVTSPYGTPFQYLSNGNLAIARFDIPAADAVGVVVDPMYRTEAIAGGILRVYVQALRSPVSMKSRRLQTVKRQNYLETTR